MLTSVMSIRHMPGVMLTRCLQGAAYVLPWPAHWAFRAVPGEVKPGRRALIPPRPQVPFVLRLHALNQRASRDGGEMGGVTFGLHPQFLAHSAPDPWSFLSDKSNGGFFCLFVIFAFFVFSS